MSSQIDFLHPDCEAVILVKPTSYSISLTFNCQFAAAVLVRHLAVAGRVL